MATRTRSRSTNENSESGGGGRTSSGWSGGQAGVLAAAAVAGAAVGLAANYGRKMVVQSMTGDWQEMLEAEHDMVRALFDKLEATEDGQTWIRAHTLTKIKNALGKHALQEENVIYPALREANQAHDADALNGEHGYIKTYLYELDTMPKEGAAWLEKAREFRAMLDEHMRMEEEQVFPAFRAALSEEQSDRLTTAMQREGMKLA
ncbi:MAG: hemerythrin domain-containing protein [Alphaproteobacteria bacterium]|nr:MAG: hemerythrin domain-containing protein [Alphaproteobacteria bacterium]